MTLIFYECISNKVNYSINQTNIVINLVFSSDDPEELTNFVNKKLESLRVNIIAWKAEPTGIVSVGVGHYYSEESLEDSEYPYWWIV